VIALYASLRNCTSERVNIRSSSGTFFIVAIVEKSPGLMEDIFDRKGFTKRI
jgi:hypothetical protein